MTWRLVWIAVPVTLVLAGIAFYELGGVAADREQRFSQCRSEEVSRYPNPIDEDQPAGNGVTFLEACMKRVGYEVDKDRVSAVCEDPKLNAQYQFCYGPSSRIRRWPYRIELILSHL